MQKSLPVYLALLSLLCPGCASTSERGIDTDPPYAVPQNYDEEAVGEEIHRTILASFHPYTDPKVVSYVNGIGQDLASCARRHDLGYQFTILYSEKIYATSAPGGYVYATTGMLNFLHSEAELAAVLAHEIAEQQYKDPRFTKTDDMISAAAQAGSAIGPMFGPIGSLASLGLVLLQAYSESTQKTPEELLLESDKNAMKYLVEAGYDPQALPDVLEHFFKAGEKIGPLFYDYYQSRPITESRMARLKKEFQGISMGSKDLKTGALEYQEITKGVREIYKTN